jgi:hypothetical protein
MRRSARRSVSRGASRLLTTFVLALVISGSLVLVGRQASPITAAPPYSMKPATYTYGQGYLFVGADGSVYNFGTSVYECGGSATSNSQCGTYGQLDTSFTGAAYVPNGSGYWLIGPDGGVFAFPIGTQAFYGSMPACHYTSPAPIAAIAAFPNGSGYWLMDQDGDVYSMQGYSPTSGCTSGPYYGGVGYECGGGAKSGTLVGITSTPDGGGYWMVSSSGTVYNCGDAQAFSAVSPAEPLVGATTNPGGGFWAAGGDGGVFSFGNAGFQGSLPPTAIDNSVVGIAATSDGGGYWMVASDGGAFVYGDAQFLGDMVPGTLPKPIVGIAAVPEPMYHRRPAKGMT